MPDVARQENVASWLAALDARVKKLETYPPGALTLLTTTGNLTPAGLQPGVTSAAVYPGTSSPSFTLQRAMQLLFIIQCNYYTSPGGVHNTANYGYVDLGVYNTATNAIVAAAPEGIHTNGPTSPVSDYVRFLPALLQAGTWAAQIYYAVDTSLGAGDTTFTVSSARIDVYTMGG